MSERQTCDVRERQIHDNKGTGVNVYGGARLTLYESEVRLVSVREADM